MQVVDVDVGLITTATILLLVTAALVVLWHMRKKITKFQILAVIVVLFNVVMLRVDAVSATVIIIALDFYVSAKEHLINILKKLSEKED